MPTNGLRASTVLRAGDISTDTANAILQSGNGIPVIHPVDPTIEVMPQEPSRVVLLNNDPGPAASNTTVVNTSAETATGAGLMAWAKANPLPAFAIAAGVTYLLYTLTKRK